MTIHIRSFQESDIDEIFAIEQESYSCPWTRTMFLSVLADQEFNYARVAEDRISGIIAGYCFFWIVPHDEVQIANLAVHPHYRRKGIARLLLNDAIREGTIKQATSVCLEVRESNTPARTLYETAGFVQVGKRLNYYNNPKEDALILRLTLS